MLRTSTGKRVGGDVATIRRLLGRAFVRSGWQQVFVENAAADVHKCGSLPVCGLFVAGALAAQEPVEATFWSPPRTLRRTARCLSLDADVDCSWTWTGCAAAYPLPVHVRGLAALAALNSRYCVAIFGSARGLFADSESCLLAGVRRALS